MDAKIKPIDPNKQGEALDNIMGFYSMVENRGLGTGFLWRFALGHEVVTNGSEPGGDRLQVSDYLGRVVIGVNSKWGTEPNEGWGDREVALLSFTLTDDEVDKLLEKAGRRWLHVYGYFEYTDLSGVLRQTGFHFSYLPIDMMLTYERAPRLWFDRIVDPEFEQPQSA